MANDWKINKGDVGGPDSGKELDGGMIRMVEDETGKTFYEFLAVVSRAELVSPNDMLQFPAFAYNGLVWHLTVDPPYAPGLSQIAGKWRNNKNRPELPVRPIDAEEDGTYTAQAGSGPGDPEEKEKRGKEDAASASA